jgi:alpha-methylacyl-CoA racemase
MSAPLDGVTVIDLTRLLPGPYLTLQLAQLGATVIKIEDPLSGGDYARMLSPELFALVNRGKQARALNLRDAADREVFLAAVDDADIVVESFRPGVLGKLGLDGAALLKRKPTLVYCALTGYGQDGPYAQRAGHDLNYAAWTGVVAGQSGDAALPGLGNLPIGDLAGGALAALGAILAALYRVARGGPGAVLDASIFDGLSALQVVALATHRALGASLPRGEDVLSGGLPVYALYRCADGRALSVAAIEPKFLSALADAVGRPELKRLPLARGPAGATLRAALSELFASRSQAEWTALLAHTDACVAPVQSVDALLDDPHFRARGLNEGSSAKPAVGYPVRFDGARLPALGPAPAVPRAG